MKRAALFLSLLLACGASSATPWYFVVDGTTKNYAMFIDGESIVTSGSKVSFWLRIIANKEDPAQTAATQLLKWEFNCKTKYHRLMSGTTYSRNGAVIKHVSTPDPAEEAMPGTVGVIILKTVCSKNFPNDPTGGNYLYMKVDSDTLDLVAAKAIQLETAKLNKR